MVLLQGSPWNACIYFITAIFFQETEEIPMTMQETYTDVLHPSSYLSGILTTFEGDPPRKKLAENYSLVRTAR